MDRAISILVTLALMELMVAIGLRVTVAELLGVARQLGLVARSAIANYAIVPAVTVLLLYLFSAERTVAAGFIILACCPGAPYGPPFTAIARGNVSAAVGLMVLLAGTSAFLAPIGLRLLLPLVSGDEPLKIDAVRMVIILLVTQLLPLCMGVALRQFRPGLADRLSHPADRVSKVLNVIAVGLVLVVQFPMLLEIRLRGFIGMLMLLVLSWSAGWLFGGRDAGARTAMTMTTSLRNVSVALVVAADSFPGTPAVTAVAAYALAALLGTLALAIAIGRFKTRDMDATAGRSEK